MNNRKKEGLSPLQMVDAARNLLIATVYIGNSIDKGTLSLGAFNENLIFAPNDEYIFLSTKYMPEIIAKLRSKQMFMKKRVWKKNDLNVFRKNLLQGVIGTCFVVLHEALSEKFNSKEGMLYEIFKGKHEGTQFSDVNKLRAVVYMLRCAFAHTPTLPKWEVHEEYRRLFHIDAIDITVDFRDLNDKVLSHEHHGGWIGVFKLMNLCEIFIKAND